MKQTADYIWALMVDYIRGHGNNIEEITEDFLKRKVTQSLIPDYLDFIQQPRHWGDELAVYWLAQMVNRAICIVMKTGAQFFVTLCQRLIKK